MACYVENVLKIAKAEVGYLEKASNKNLDSKTGNAGNKNYTKYARDLDNVTGFYNGRKNGYAWCDVFVDWCFYKAYGVTNAKKLLCQPSESLGAGCEYSLRYYKAKNQFYTSPKAGDQIFFKDSDGDIIHTGIVYKVDKTYVYTYEGNTSSASGVVANGGCVRAKKYSLTYSRIAGYGRPAYDVKKTTTTTKGTTYTVVKGDSLYKIGKKFGVSWTKIASANSIKAPWTLRVGQKLTIPGATKTVTTTTKSTTYTVVKGDSLYKIGKKFGVSWTKIASANGIKAPWTISVGQKLTIPGK